MPRFRLTAFVALAALGVLGAGCTTDGGGAGDAPTTSWAESARSATPEPTIADSVVADGSATDNLPLFDRVTREVWDSDARGAGRAYVDALVEVGFDREAMQVTEDVTTIGNPAESLQFSVRWDEECLIGQVGPSIGEPVTGVFAGLPDDRCLIGVTRLIDW